MTQFNCGDINIHVDRERNTGRGTCIERDTDRQAERWRERQR